MLKVNLEKIKFLITQDILKLVLLLGLCSLKDKGLD